MRLLKLLISVWLFAICHQHSSAEEKDHNLSICATFRNEAPFLKEWIEYHLLVGVDHFYLYDVGSVDDYMRVLNPYIRGGIVTLVSWVNWNEENEKEDSYLWSLGVQIPAYENAARFLAVNETKWLTFLDVHEFLVSPTEDNIITALDFYDEYPGVTLKCNFFNAAKNSELLPRKKLVIQASELSNPYALHPYKTVTKMIFKPDRCKGSIWPPYQCVFKNLQIAANAEKSSLRINNYFNRKGDPFLYKTKDRFYADNRSMRDEDIARILSFGYEIEDQEQSIQRFIPKLSKKLGLDLYWGW
jgi:hypothetical protein